MSLFIRTVRGLSMTCGVIAALGLAAAILVVCQMVVVRYVLDGSTVWQTEFVTYAVAASTFIGSPYVLLHKGHVNVDLLPIYLGHGGRVMLALVAAVISLAFCVIIAWYGWLLFEEARSEGWRTDTIWKLPLWIPYLPLPIGMGVLSLQYVADIACILRGEDLPFGLRQEDLGEEM